MLVRSLCFLLVILATSEPCVGQEQTNDSPSDAPLRKVSAPQAKGSVDASPATDQVEKPAEIESPVGEPFELPALHHSWARFQPGAWRELQTVTKMMDENGKPATENMTTQRETLEAVAQGKYVLKVQATVAVGGKQIVGEEKTRTLHLPTDGAGLLSGTKRLDDQILSINGRGIACEVWELSYQEDARNLRDLVYYSGQHFPYILRRETFVDEAEAGKEKQGELDEELDASSSVPPTAEKREEVIALEVPAEIDGKIQSCVSIRTHRHHGKGDTVRLKLICSGVPGGEISVSTTELDAQGNVIRMSVTSLLASDGVLIPAESGLAESAEP